MSRKGTCLLLGYWCGNDKEVIRANEREVVTQQHPAEVVLDHLHGVGFDLVEKHVREKTDWGGEMHFILAIRKE